MDLSSVCAGSIVSTICDVAGAFLQIFRVTTVPLRKALRTPCTGSTTLPFSLTDIADSKVRGLSAYCLALRDLMKPDSVEGRGTVRESLYGSSKQSVYSLIRERIRRPRT